MLPGPDQTVVEPQEVEAVRPFSQIHDPALVRVDLEV
jgi:hypothetical protein